MTTIENVIKFLNDYVIECAPDDGCQRCNEAREHVAALEKLSLPPAEGAEAIVKKYEDEYDFKFHWVQRDRVIRMMREFAAQQQPTAEGAEEIAQRCPVCGGNGLVSNGFYTQTSGHWSSNSTVPETCRSCNGTGVVFATLHAQRIADKMVEKLTPSNEQPKDGRRGK